MQNKEKELGARCGVPCTHKEVLCKVPILVWIQHVFEVTMPHRRNIIRANIKCGYMNYFGKKHFNTNFHNIDK